MAGVGEEYVDYESDPEEAKLSLKMRRREASDDEEEADGVMDGDEEGREKPPTRRIVDSDGESDKQGAAAEYEEEIEDEDEEYFDEDVEELEEEEQQLVEEEYCAEVIGPEGSGEVGDVARAVGGAREREAGKELDGDGGRSAGDFSEVQQGVDANNQFGDEKKENEPFAVPTAGAFYMHDDRFRNNAGGRHRRTLGGRKLWESKDDRKWGHDKFEEMNMKERNYDKGRRTSRGRYRGRGRNPGVDSGYSRGNRPKAYNSSNQSNAHKGVKGRGPRRYQSSMKNNDEGATTQNRQSGKPIEKMPNASSGKVPAPPVNVDSDPVPDRKHVFASSLSSASPPFYPSGSSNKDVAVTQKRDLHADAINQNLHSPPVEESFSMPRSNTMMRGKNVADSIGMDGLHIDESMPRAAGKLSTSLHKSAVGLSLMESSLSPQSRARGRGLTPMGQMTYSQVSRVSTSTQLQNVQQTSPSGVQSSFQASGQQLAQHPGSASEVSSSPKEALPINSSERSELESPPESNKSKRSLVAKGKASVQRSERGSFLYGGAQVLGGSGNVVGSHGDQNFPATSSFLPVMQFGGQRPGGIGVPAVGMAFPGYVANPQLGLGNSEMTWLPILAGAAGALGATYCPPYLAVDGSYSTHQPGQASSSAVSSSKENSANKPNKEWKPSQTPEITNDEFGQRQNKTRSRYTEMKFSSVK